MGPWDIMSHHFIERTKPPQGISSFTKIRLGWISLQQVLQVNPGSTQCAFLSPLSKKGETLAVKIPLGKGQSGGSDHYYLVENRQPIGYDRLLPDSGILVLKVDATVREGSGTVKVMDADPDSPYFSHATFRLDRNNRNVFVDKGNNVSVIPLWSENENLGVLITTPEESADALKAALLIQKVLQRFPQQRSERAQKYVDDCIQTFKKSDFRIAHQKAQEALR
jgi:hypothetical protein